MKKIILIAMSLLVLIFSKNVFAALKLNEIYPAPLTGEDEWVEIYNDENNSVNIQDFYLTDSSGKKILMTDETLRPYSFTIASTPSGVLNNSNQTGKNYADIIYLYDTNNQSIDIATYSGTFDSNKTFAKCPNGSGNWFVLNTLTKNASNETVCQSLTPTLIITPIITFIPTITSTPEITGRIYPSPTESISFNNVYISEVMVNTPTGEKEWVEIYNDNDFSVTLNNWYIDDLENSGSTPKIFSLEIDRKSYAVFDLTSSMFNNDGDGVRLLESNKNLKDDFEYSKSEQGKTLGRTSIDSDSFCLQEPSKNSVNNSCINLITTITSISPTTTVITSKTPINMGLINQTPIAQINFYIPNPTPYTLSPNILGISTKINHNNSSSINLLCFLSVFYSLLTIISILFKMKLLYGKNKNIYSSPLHSS